uniref:HEAT repeat domain-containing protein n=1 Tax=Strongyloides stercoralis TaxID=6248 RepID=A0A0K0E710_STRER
MEDEVIFEIQRVLSYQYYNTIINDLTYLHPPKCIQIIEHFNLATNTINNDKIKLNISPTKFYSVGLFIRQLIEFSINISLRKSIIEFYCTLYKKINEIYGCPFVDKYILKVIFLHFYDENYGTNSNSGLEENNFIEDSIIRALSFKVCFQCIDNKSIKTIFDEDDIFDKVIHVFYKKSAYFFQFLIIPTVFCNIKEDVWNILHVSGSIFDSLVKYLKIMIDCDNFYFYEKITKELLEKMSITIKLMYSTILGESIHKALLTPVYLDGVKYNLYKIISFILKFTVFIENEKYILIFNESVRNVTKILLKICSIENVSTESSEIFNNYRSELIEIKELLICIQSKFNFDIIFEPLQMDKNEEIENDIVKSLKVMKI